MRQPQFTGKPGVYGALTATGSAPVIILGGTTLKLGDVIHVVQELPKCKGHTALEVKVACIDPPITGNPAGLNLFPVGHATYSDGGTVKGTVYYPAEDDGENQPFNKRLTKVGRTAIVFMVHGNHCPDSDPSHLGYDYFQVDLAKMGIIAVSVDSNALNCRGEIKYVEGVQNIEQRADLMMSMRLH